MTSFRILRSVLKVNVFFHNNYTLAQIMFWTLGEKKIEHCWKMSIYVQHIFLREFREWIICIISP